jgi:hypothetical protein
MGQMAYEASVNGYPSASLGADNAFDMMPWKAVIGYKTGMIDPYDDIYIAATEKVYDDKTAFMGGAINQSYGRNISGSKYEYTMNAGMNISDFIYLGASFTINSLDYSYSEYFRETAVDPGEFKITYEDQNENEIPSMTKYFNRMKYNSSYTYSGVGYSAKFGIIVTPLKGLRLGAALQTPTVMRIDESWEESGETEFLGEGGGRYSCESPYGENEWSFRTPLKANFGVAYTFGTLGLISADYELSDYGNLSYKSSSYTDMDVLDDLNDEMKASYGVAHKLRIGAEF